MFAKVLSSYSKDSLSILDFLFYSFLFHLCAATSLLISEITSVENNVSLKWISRTRYP